jgi:hypothetical protein
MLPVASKDRMTDDSLIENNLEGTGSSLTEVRGRVSKQITNGSKTAVMDVIGFLCVSVRSSRAQPHDNLGSRRGWFHSQNGDRASEVYYQRGAFCCAFFVGERTRFKGHS